MMETLTCLMMASKIGKGKMESHDRNHASLPSWPSYLKNSFNKNPARVLRDTPQSKPSA